MKKNIIALAAAVAVAAICYIIGRHDGAEMHIAEIADTVTVVTHDTIREVCPVAIEHRIVDTIYMPVEVERIVTDTVTDMVIVELEREQRAYGDSTYRAWVSGVEPKLDSIQIRQNTVYHLINQYVERKWAIGVTAGYGITYQGQLRASPYIGVGIQYNIWQF